MKKGETMETKQTKEVAKKQTAQVSVFAQTTQDTVDFDPSDILIPKLLLMQGPSQLVAEGKASQGDMINSVTGEKLGDKTKGVTIIPLTHFKTMTVMRDKGGMYVFDHIEPWTVAHASKSFEEETNGAKYKNYPTLNFYVMLEKDLKENKSAMPVLVSFKSTSLKAGKKLINHFAMAGEIGQKPCSGMLTLTCTVKKGDKGPYHAFDVVFEKNTPNEYGAKLLQWEKILKQNKVKVDASHEDHEEAGVELNSQSEF
jgi:ribosomal protein S6